jgi:hypothetical protein
MSTTTLGATPLRECNPTGNDRGSGQGERVSLKTAVNAFGLSLLGLPHLRQAEPVG